MKKLVITGLVVTLGLAPAFALAQTGGGTSGSGSGSRGGSSTTPSSENITNKADCDRAGGKWSAAQKKCSLGG
jgi:hypothetical protein